MWLVTSIPAKNQNSYADAFKSWQAIGAKVFSINNETELRELDVNLFGSKNILADYDYSDIYSRPLIGINEALLKISQIAPEGEIIGIVNADIYPFNGFEWNDNIKRIGDKDLYIYKRTDFKAIPGDSEVVYEPTVYKYGYDLFLLKNTKQLKQVIADHSGDLAFGVPWWDYWFPIKCLKHGYNIVSYENCSIFHQLHDEQFSQEIWRNKGEDFKSYLLNFVSSIDKSFESELFSADLITLCEKTIRFIDSQKFLKNVESNIGKKLGISIVTACMNRNNNLSIALRTWINCGDVNEIVIVDWSSKEFVKDTLKKLNIFDERIKIIRKNDEPAWNLCKAYNLGFSNVSYSKLLKLDADVCLASDFFVNHPFNDNVYYSGSWKTAKNDSEKRLNGSFYTKTANVIKIGGYNEVIDTYGWDDSDLYQRLIKLASQKDFDTKFINHIEQTEESRTENSKKNILFKSLHPSIFTELEIRKNEWKAFLRTPNLPFFNITYSDTNISEEYCYKKAIIGFLSASYEESGLGLKKSFLNRLSLDTLHNLFLFRHCKISWKPSYQDVLYSMSSIPLSKKDNLLLLNHKDSPYMSTDCFIEKFPEVIVNDFISKIKNYYDNSLISFPMQIEDSSLANDFFYKSSIAEKSVNKEITIPVVVYKAKDFVQGLLQDIESQTAFSSCLFVFVIADKDEYSEIISFCKKHPDNTTLISLMYDPGLYGCWNYVVSSSMSKYISNWNVDDRRKQSHIAEMVGFLEDHPHYSAVCSGLYVSRIKNKTFLECESDANKEVWFNDKCEVFDHKDLFQKQWWLSQEDPERETVISQNFLHCMPVWRRKLHEKYGFFNEKKYGASADWEFWLRCGLGGESFYRTSKVLGVYFLNEHSYGRATEGVVEKEKNIFSEYFRYSKIY